MFHLHALKLSKLSIAEEMPMEETGMWEPMMARLFAEPRYKRNTPELSGDEGLEDNSSDKDSESVNIVNLDSENNN